MMGWQAEGAAPIVLGAPVENPETIATAIRIGNPASWEQAVTAATDSSGAIDMVSDEEILDAQRTLARSAGIFVEPASAAGIAGLLKCHAAGNIPEGSTVVVTVTGHGLKDPEVAVENSLAKSTVVDANLDSVLAVIGLD
jgi:threonine synthase